MPIKMSAIMLTFLHFCFNLFFDSVSHNSWTTLGVFVVNVCPSAIKPSNKMCHFRIHHTPAVNFCFLSVNDNGWDFVRIELERYRWLAHCLSSQ